MDIGCYCINVSRYLFDAEPCSAQAQWAIIESHGVDATTLAILNFPNNCFASFTSSMLLHRTQQYQVIGTEGTISVPTALPLGDHSPLVQLHTRDGMKERTIPQVDHYQLQIEHISHCILDDTKLTYPAENGLANMRVIEMVRKAAQTQLAQ